MLTREECQTIHAKNAGKRVWLEKVAANDGRLALANADGYLHVWWDAEHDMAEQAQAARLCGAINELVTAKMREPTF